MQLALFAELPSEILGDSKVCSKCSIELPLSSFSYASGGNYLRSECKDCANNMSRLRAELKSTVAPPPAGYVCPICLGTEAEVLGRGNKANGAWVLDHNHKTEQFRGWLCHTCNRGLGAFVDDTDRMLRAIGYLNG